MLREVSMGTYYSTGTYFRGCGARRKSVSHLAVCGPSGGGEWCRLVPALPSPAAATPLVDPCSNPSVEDPAPFSWTFVGLCGFAPRPSATAAAATPASPAIRGTALVVVDVDGVPPWLLPESARPCDICTAAATAETVMVLFPRGEEVLSMLFPPPRGFRGTRASFSSISRSWRSGRSLEAEEKVIAGRGWKGRRTISGANTWSHLVGQLELDAAADTCRA